MEDLKRLIKAIKVDSDLTNRDIANDLGIKESDLDNMIYGRKKYDQKFINTVKSKYLKKNVTEVTPHNSIMMVPFVPKRAWAGFPDQFEDNNFIQELEKIPMASDHQGKGEYLAFEVAGDSMTAESEHSIPESSKVFTRKIPSHYWKDGLRIKDGPFVVITKTGDIFLKRIYSMNKQTGDIILKSLNILYEDININLDDCKAIYSVISIMTKPLRY